MRVIYSSCTTKVTRFLCSQGGKNDEHNCKRKQNGSDASKQVDAQYGNTDDYFYDAAGGL